MPRALSPQLLPASGSAIFPHFLLEDLPWQSGAKEEAPHPNATTLALGNLTSLSCHDWSSPMALCSPTNHKQRRAWHGLGEGTGRDEWKGQTDESQSPLPRLP